VALIGAREDREASLEKELASLRREIDAQSAANGNSELLAIRRELDRMALLAGTTAARGPGVVVELSDSPLAKPDDPSSADFQIQDVDVQLVVNALWDAGAEAIDVNGQRIVSTTAIRAAGGAILVNYRVLTSPYHIEAIGDAGVLQRSFEASTIAQRFRGWVDAYRLGFSVKASGKLLLPAYSGSVRYRYAQPAQG
jgi:uncharacterized protein YlxW (UPF0749 family)